MSEIRFGNYRVVEAIGSGAIATVYRAVQEPLGRVVALKALKTQIAPTSSFGLGLDREAKILRDLAHPNVVLLLDSLRNESGRPFLVLENIEGPSVQQLLEAKKRPLGLEASLAIALGLCAGLEHVHERGVVHRDVKPSNVLLARGGIVKLIDFGIAQQSRTASVSDVLAEGVTPSGRIAPEPVKDAFGTAAYMSPEQILGDFVDGRSDLFSLGVVLYQMLSGTRPFESPSAAGGARDRPSRPPGGPARTRRDAPAKLSERAPHVPRPIERLVMRLLEKSPNERYASATAVHERLSRELRALTNADPAAVIRAALSEGGFVPSDRRGPAPVAVTRRRETRLSRVLLGQGAVLVLFIGSVLAIEGGFAHAAGDPGDRPLELMPDQAGGLRVLATPWAYVKVDGQEVETTPFARPIPLAPGTHYITLVHPDALPVEREVQILPNETTILDVTMVLGGAEDAGKR